MLILFFTIVFIAELIVLEKIVFSILNIRRRVCDVNLQVTQMQPQMVSKIKDFRIITSKILSKLNCFVTFVVEKRINCGENIKRNLFIRILAFVMKLPVKRIFMAVDTILAIRKFLKRL